MITLDRFNDRLKPRGGYFHIFMELLSRGSERREKLEGLGDFIANCV